MMEKEIHDLINEQMLSWDLAKQNYSGLKQVKTKEFTINQTTYKVQFNPARILSSNAKVDSQSIRERKCFLCKENLPNTQRGLLFEDKYQLLVNPYPIFPKHLTIPDLNHTDQRIAGRFIDMLNLAEALEEFVIFYNGPKCGASAPDHAHFQAGNKGFLPIENDWKKLEKEEIKTVENATLWELKDSPRATLVIEATDKQAANNLFELVYSSLDHLSNEEEPMMNIVTWKEKERWITCIFPRKQHRPSCFFSENADHLLISPASVDMGGVFITPQEEDFEKINADAIAKILQEVCFSATDLLKIKQNIQSI